MDLKMVDKMQEMSLFLGAGKVRLRYIREYVVLISSIDEDQLKRWTRQGKEIIGGV